jgi:hypothetical protein
MRTSITGSQPLARLSTLQKLSLGAILSILGSGVIVLSLTLGWSSLPRPWGFIIGFAAGVTGGTGVPLAVCGLVQSARPALRRNAESRRNSCPQEPTGGPADRR